jgi:hypothetical protein
MNMSRFEVSSSDVFSQSQITLAQMGFQRTASGFIVDALTDLSRETPKETARRDRIFVLEEEKNRRDFWNSVRKTEKREMIDRLRDGWFFSNEDALQQVVAEVFLFQQAGKVVDPNKNFLVETLREYSKTSPIARRIVIAGVLIVDPNNPILQQSVYQSDRETPIGHKPVSPLRFYGGNSKSR